MFRPFPTMYNPFLVSEPTYTASQQTVYPQMTGEIEAQLSDANRLYPKNNPGIDITKQPDPLYSMANIGMPIRPREYNQPTKLQERLSNYSNIVKNIEDVKSPFASYGDMNKEGVLLQKDISTPEYDQMTGNVEIPYVMDYTPFASEEEMNKFYNPSIQEAEIVGKYSEPIGPKNYTYQTLGPEPYEYSKEPIGPMPYEYSKEPIGPKPFEYRYDKPIGPEPFDYRYDKPIGPEPFEYEKTSPNTETNLLTQTPKNKFGTPEAYYLGKSMLDATALINNMVQPQPPSMQMKIPHYERQRLNPEPYDAMRSQMRDQGTQAYRLQRENISQASDLMKGLAAVTSGIQQGLMQVGMQQAGAEQQIQGINQQISMQEQQQQTQMLNQESATNYQIQQQAQQYKDQMVSAQLARLGDTAGAYAKYVNMKDIVSKQDAVNKAAIQSTNDIQNAMLQYQMHKDAMDSDEYKSAWAQHWTKTLDQMSTDKIKDERFGALKEYYGEMSPKYSDYQRIAMDPTFTKSYYQKKNDYENFQRLYPGGVAPDKTKYANETDYNNAVADFQKAEANSKAFTEDKSYKQFEQMQDFWTEIGNERDESGERKRFADQYMGQRGYYTTEQLLKTVQEALDRSKQSLEI